MYINKYMRVYLYVVGILVFYLLSVALKRLYAVTAYLNYELIMWHVS